MYSQQNEDDIFMKLLPAKGRLLEIGAWDPVTFSNSRALIEKGWEAVLVEPSPAPLRKLLMEYGSNAGVKILAAAVAHEEIPYVRMMISDDGVTTSQLLHFEKWEAQAKFLGNLWVPCFTPMRLAELFGGFDFISIDAEGCSVEIAVEMLKTHQPVAWCIEHDGRTVELSKAASRHGYGIAELNDTNMILVKK